MRNKAIISTLLLSGGRVLGLRCIHAGPGGVAAASVNTIRRFLDVPGEQRHKLREHSVDPGRVLRQRVDAMYKN